MQPAPKMLLLSGPVVLAGLFSLLPTNSFLTLLVASFTMGAIVAANISCHVVLIIYVEHCKHLLTFLTRGEQQITTLPFDLHLQLQHSLTEILEVYRAITPRGIAPTDVHYLSHFWDKAATLIRSRDGQIFASLFGIPIMLHHVMACRVEVLRLYALGQRVSHIDCP